MNFTKLTFFNLALLMAIAATAQKSASMQTAPAQSLYFTVSMDSPASHKFHVTLHYTGPASPALDLKMPAWMPG